MSHQYWFSILLLIVMLYPRMQAQEQKYPAEYVPSAGDTLDVVERNHYGLFRSVYGFQWAAFTLNPDSSLQADVCYVMNRVRKHIIVPRFRSLLDAEDRVEEAFQGVWKRESEYDGVAAGEKEKAEGPWQLVLAGGERLFKCKLIDLNNDSLAVKHHWGYLSIHVESIEKLVQTNRSGWSGVIIGTFVGASTLALIAYATDKGGMLGRDLAAAGGATVGAVVGALVGGAIAGGDKVQDLSGKSVPEKLAVIRSLMYE